MIALWLGALCHAEAPPADYRSWLDQAKLFVRREWYGDAEEQLILATSSEDGRLDPEAWFLLARVRYALSDIAGARHAADRALVNSQDEAQRRQAAELLAFFEQQFGWVHLVPPHPGVATRLDVELKSVIFDPELRDYYTQLTTRLEEPVVLPWSLGLPTGTYLVNGEEVVVAAGEEMELAPAIRGRTVGLQVVQLELGVGVTAWLGDHASSLVPAPTVTGAVSQPIGPVVLGIVGEWRVSPFRDRTGDISTGLGGWALGARLGVEMPGTAPLVIRPSLGYRLARVPGIEAACAIGRSDAVCSTDRTREPREMFVHPTGTAHVPFVELTTLYLDRRRKQGVGVGLTLAGQLALGTVPREGRSDLPDGTGVSWTVNPDQRRWTAPGVRALLDLTYAL